MYPVHPKILSNQVCPARDVARPVQDRAMDGLDGLLTTLLVLESISTFSIGCRRFPIFNKTDSASVVGRSFNSTFWAAALSLLGLLPLIPITLALSFDLARRGDLERRTPTRRTASCEVARGGELRRIGVQSSRVRDRRL